MVENQIRDALLKVALGYSVAEVTEEFSVEDGELKLIKRKETKKDIPPDLKAAKLLMEDTDYSALTDEQLETERKKLIQALSEDKE